MAMDQWNFDHTIQTEATVDQAWTFLSDMSNQVRMEPGIENIELDGPFVNGTRGRTITKVSTQEWQLENVVENEQFTIRGYTEEEDMSLSFTWTFESTEDGARLTQNIRAEGDDLDAYAETFFSMEETVPARLELLVNELNELT